MKNERYFPLLVLAILAGVATSFLSVASADTTAKAPVEVHNVSLEAADIVGS